jgi:hypothetical protein
VSNEGVGQSFPEFGLSSGELRCGCCVKTDPEALAHRAPCLALIEIAINGCERLPQHKCTISALNSSYTLK